MMIIDTEIDTISMASQRFG